MGVDTPFESQPPSTSPPPTEEGPITQCLTHLQTPSDTSRFVGLAMLSSILKHANIANDRTILRKVWEVMPYRFLDRLLKSRTYHPSSRQSSKTPADQAKDMVELAVNVIHAFALLLPAAADNLALVDRAPRLIAALHESSEQTKIVILETLSVYATKERGAETILSSEISPLLDAAPSYDQGMQVVLYTLVNGSKSETGLPLVMKALPEILQRYSEALLKGISAENCPLRARLLSFFSELLPRLLSPLLPTSTTWAENIYTSIRRTITTTHSPSERTHSTIISATLLQSYPPSLLFHPPPKSAATPKPFTPFFVRLLLIDIRSTIPSLMEQLSSPTYPQLSHRLSCGFDVLASFIGYLVQLDSPFDETELDPEALLKFRSEMGETLSLTIEFLRDRWDAKFAGASGYEMDTSMVDDRGEAKGTLRGGGPLNLAWDAADIEGGLARDPVVVSAIRALSLWLREDDSLAKEAGGLMDVFLGLWKQSQNTPGAVDYRLWLVSALEGTLAEKNGREMFRKLGGWELLWGEVRNLYQSSAAGTWLEIEVVKLAIEEVRVLQEWVGGSEYLSIPNAETKVQEMVKVARVTRPLPQMGEEAGRVWLGLDVGVVRLAVRLVKKLPRDSWVLKQGVEERVGRLTRELGETVQERGMGLKGSGEVGKQEEVVFLLAEVMEELGLI
ncbi:Neurochondrin-domain-containing protein [Tirmania nivea]|nr:Neurochondrin-domain-containing protein [Tirmania nivea]